jgi:hypothetical protein
LLQSLVANLIAPRPDLLPERRMADGFDCYEIFKKLDKPFWHLKLRI